VRGTDSSFRYLGRVGDAATGEPGFRSVRASERGQRKRARGTAHVQANAGVSMSFSNNFLPMLHVYVLVSAMSTPGGSYLFLRYLHAGLEEWKRSRGQPSAGV
ncbi:unnamed protein product, partial [Ectocarpus sp. 4 AP-2014]